MEPKHWPSQGHFNLDQYYFVTELLSNKNIEYAIETGFATGRSALSVLNNCKNIKKFISIDINFGYITIGKQMRILLEDTFENYHTIENDSKKVLTADFFASNYPHGIDYALVDGDHSYDGCYGDLELFLPQMRTGGVILIDDYKSHEPNGCSIPAVTKACDDFYEKYSDKIEKNDWNMHGKGFCIFTVQ